MKSQNKLFAVYLGGRAPKSNTELHDVVFVTGETIKDTYWQCLDKWFGTPKGLHLDSWMEIDIVDGYRVTLVDKKIAGNKKLYFVNLGSYKDGEFSEIHANKLLVADSMPEAKARAKKELLKGWPSAVHTDDLYEVDDCMELGAVNSFYVSLEETSEKENLKPNNAYHIIPKSTIEEYMQRNQIALPLMQRDAYDT